MTSSLVGSEMCIRDSFSRAIARSIFRDWHTGVGTQTAKATSPIQRPVTSCLLYTSDAADDM
eukprot:5159155-Prorocentrum_lima.AAC.1